MFVLQKKYDEAIAQRNEAAGVASQLHDEVETYKVLLGAALKKAGGRIEIKQSEIEALEGHFAMSKENDVWTIETVVLKDVVGPPVVPLKSDCDAEAGSPSCDDCGPGECIHQQPAADTAIARANQA